jgi:hypothetical protein
MHSPPIQSPSFPPEVQLSATQLSPSEEAGHVAIAIGLRGDRSHQAPRSRPGPQSVCFVWPSPSQHHPLPRRTA